MSSSFSCVSAVSNLLINSDKSFDPACFGTLNIEDNIIHEHHKGSDQVPYQEQEQCYLYASVRRGYSTSINTIISTCPTGKLYRKITEKP